MNIPDKKDKQRIMNDTGVSEVTLDKVIETFVSGTAKKSKLISRGFNTVVINEDINPSVAWSSVVQPLYILMYDSMNSWRSASGSAFRDFILEYYNLRFPPQYQIESINNDKACSIIDNIGLQYLDVKDLDLIIKVMFEDKWRLLGIIHAHTSLRNRISAVRTASKELIDMNILSPVITLDTQQELETNSVKNRRLIEDENTFSNMYCYNTKVNPTTSDISDKNIKTLYVPDENDVFIKDVKSHSMKIGGDLLKQRTI